MSSNVLQLLVPTKLAPPQPGAAWVRRERLMARLSEPPRPRLTLVVAPAGFGKTTLVAQWLAGVPSLPLAWLSLDEHDQDSMRFLAYVAGAVDRAAPGSVTTTRQLLAAAEPPPPYSVVQSLIVDISKLAAGLTVVLDDYCLISAQAIHQLVAYLLRNLPDSCRLVILSRTDPPLPLVRLRAEGQLREVRAHDLRFTTAEAEAFVGNLLGAPPEEALLATIQQQAEGWAIALQLAALAQQAAPGDGASQRLASSRIAEYLAEEILARQPSAVQESLLALAVPERFCAGLCAALQGSPDGVIAAESLLHELSRANLLLIPLEGAGSWYRFHPLFRELLLRRLRLTGGRAGVAAHQLAAARWLEGAGLVEEALRLYLAARDEGAAGALVERLLFRELGRDISSGPPRYWLRLLPAELHARRPGLTLIAARIAVVAMDVAAAAECIAQVDDLLAAAGGEPRPPPWPTFRGDLEVLRGTVAYWQGRPAEAIEALSGGLREGTVPALATSGLLFLGRAYVAAGRFEEGVQVIGGWQGFAAGFAAQSGEGMRQTALCMMYELAGRIDDFERTAQRLGATLAADKVRGSWATFAASYMGRAAFERSDLAAAAGHFAQVRAHKYHTNAYNYVGCLIGLALIALAQGAPEEAAGYEGEVRAFAAEVGGAFLRNEAIGCSLHLALARGDTAAALALAKQIAPDSMQGSRAWYAVPPPQLGQARALIAAGGDHVRRAGPLIDAVMAQVAAMHNMRPLACALATRVLLQNALGRPEEARATLDQVLALAAGLGLVRTLVDCGPALLPLLRDAAARGVEPAYLRRLLPHFEPAPLVGSLAADPLPPALPAFLTRRELEILGLLAGRRTDREIAEQLRIAPNTVRKHTGSIYGKLGVAGRREAVAAARSLGLLRES